MNLTLTEKIALCEQIEGMTSKFALAVMDSIFTFQNNSITGDVLEIGTYKGKSALMLALNCQQDEQLLLIDRKEYLEREKIVLYKPDFKFLLQTSREFLQNLTENFYEKFKIIHIDSSHTFDDTFSEMLLCEKLIKKGGVAIFDDFLNPHYMQCSAAVYKYLYTQPTKLTIFLLSNNKAFLCRKDDYKLYKKYIVGNIQDHLETHNIYSQLSRTDKELDDFKAFFLKPLHKKDYDVSRIYGDKMFKGFIK